MKLKIFKIILIVFLINFIFSVYPKDSYSQDYQYLKYKEIIQLLKDNKYSEAGQNFLNISIQQLKEEKKSNFEISPSLFSLILAGISFEKSRDTITYDIWKVVNKGYLKTTTSWESERKKLEEKILIINNVKEKTPDDIILLELDELLKVSSYFGPDSDDIKKNNESVEFLTTYNNIFNNQNIEVKAASNSGKTEEVKNILQNNKNVIDASVKIAKESTLINKISPENKNVPQKKVETNKSKIDFNNDSDLARIAWKYFEKNYQPKTGLFDSSHYYPYTTLWDLASSLAGIVCANKLGLIDKTKTDTYLKKILNSISLLKLYKNELPNREYNTSTLKMAVGGIEDNTGSGWSALDIGRLLIWLKIIEKNYPEYSPQINSIIKKWKFNRLSNEQKMNGTILNNGVETLRQEGRLGYEQYSATGFYLWGIKLPKSLDYENTKSIKILGIDLLYDTRNLAYLTSEPFILAKLELGKIDNIFEELTKNIYLIQKKRWDKFKILTAVSEDSINKYPWFVYNSVNFNGKNWLCTNPAGKVFPQFKGLSTKASFAWSAIYNDEYSKLLKNKVKVLVNPEFGFYAGNYELNNEINTSININTNAVILESLLYLKSGKKSFLENK